MEKINYILNHSSRVFVKEQCEFFKKEKKIWKKSKGKVVIPVGSLVSNHDPYVFHNPWLYGYCKDNFLSNQTGPNSVIIFGTHKKDNSKQNLKFLVDTIFVTGNKYSWFKPCKGYSPNKNPNHLPIKYIFTAKTYDLDKNNFSFIPLNLDKNNIYNLIDIAPIIEKNYSEFFDILKKHPKKLYKISELMLDNIIKYIYENSNILVTKTEGKGSPKELDMNLQYKYYKTIYESKDKSIHNTSNVYI